MAIRTILSKLSGRGLFGKFSAGIMLLAGVVTVLGAIFPEESIKALRDIADSLEELESRTDDPRTLLNQRGYAIDNSGFLKALQQSDPIAINAFCSISETPIFEIDNLFIHIPQSTTEDSLRTLIECTSIDTVSACSSSTWHIAANPNWNEAAEALICSPTQISTRKELTKVGTEQLKHDLKAGCIKLLSSIDAEVKQFKAREQKQQNYTNDDKTFARENSEFLLSMGIELAEIVFRDETISPYSEYYLARFPSYVSMNEICDSSGIPYSDWLRVVFSQPE